MAEGVNIFMRFDQVVLAGILLFTSACARKETPLRQYPFRGTIVRLSKDTNLASIRGEKVDGWMEAMTMEYPIENPAEFRSLRKGEKIVATVNVNSEGYWLTNVKERSGD